MTTAAELLAEVQALGVVVELAGPDRLRARPADVIPAELWPELRERKAELVALLSEHWPPECLESEVRFGVMHARLFPLLGREVGTPLGRGELVQVFAGRATVVRGGRACFLYPEDVTP